MSYTLIDGWERNTEHPDTFEIPSMEEAGRVTIGDFVKLGFEYEDDAELAGERMWVEVTGIGNGGFVGTLANAPFAPISLDMDYGDEVEFGLRHIIGVMEDEDDS